MHAPTVVVVTDAPAADDVALISDALDGFNVETAGTYDARPLAVLVKDAETNRVVGGLTGRTVAVTPVHRPIVASAAAAA
jgi:hypothetical protein